MIEDKRSEIMRKVQALLAKAESTTFGPEQEALLNKVDKLMEQYAIAQWEIDQMANPNERVKPEKHSFPVCDHGNHLWQELVNLSTLVCRFFGVRPVYAGLASKGRYPIDAIVVGFPESNRTAEQLFVALKTQLLSQINPHYDQNKSCEDNIVTMKDAGMTWSNIFAELKKGAAHDAKAASLSDGEEKRSKLGRIKTVYDGRKRALGEPTLKTNPKNYQINFADAFNDAIAQRMYEIKQARQQHETRSESTALVLRSRDEEVDEMFRELWGDNLRIQANRQTKANGQARQAGHRAGRNADMSGATRPVKGSAKELRR